MTAEPLTLDAMTRCRTPGCEWHVLLPQQNCADHGGDDPSAEYLESTAGAIVATRGFDFDLLRECE
jgi:hypothetical protein